MINDLSQLNHFITGREERVSVALHDLETGAEYLFRANESMHPASTFKVAVMVEVFHQAAQGLFSLEDQIPVTNSFISIADGSPFSVRMEDDAETTLYEGISGTETLLEMVRLMIVRSSNLATNILISLISAPKTTLYLHELGIEGITVLRGPEDNRAYALGMNNSATARGLMLLMKCIAEGKAVSPGASMQMLEILLGQEFNEGLPAGLPPSARAAHKTGWNEHLYHDLGIVLTEGRKAYVLAVMTEGFKEEPLAHAFVAEVSRLAFLCLRSGS